MALNVGPGLNMLQPVPPAPPPSIIPAVSGIIDATVYHGQQAIKKKLDLGKLS